MRCLRCRAELSVDPNAPCPGCGGCRVCGDPNVRARGRCSTDAQFRRRTRRDRTEDEVIVNNIRRLNKKLAVGR